MTQFFELLQIALGRKTGLSKAPTQEEWVELYAIAKKQALVGITYAAIERLSCEQRPSRRLMLQWAISANNIKEINADFNRKINPILTRFKNAGFGTLVLKGQAIAQYYAIDKLDELRTPGDLDLWLDGSRDDIISYVKKHKTDCTVVYHHVDFHPIDDVEIEIHFTPSWMNNYYTNKRLQRFFNQGKKAQFNASDNEGATTPMPTLAFNRVYILIHIYRHLFHTGIGLRQMLDYYYVLRQGFSEQERQETMKVISALKMKRFAGATMWVLQYVFGLEENYLIAQPSEKDGRFLLREIILAGNFGVGDTRMRRGKKDTDLAWGIRKVWRNFSFVWSYPSEVLWSPIFKIWHYFWRKKYA